MFQPGDIEYIIITLVLGIPVVIILGICLLIYNLLDRFFNGNRKDKDIDKFIR